MLLFFQKKISIFILFGCLSAILLIPIASIHGIPNHADYINHVALIIQAKTAILEGQFPLRVAPFEHSGWRYPLYQFSSPTSYLFTGLIYRWITPSSPVAAFTLALWCSLMMGAIYMYRTAYFLTHKKLAAFLGSIVYLTAPYYIIVINRLGNLNEALALGIIPVVLYYSLKCYEKPNDNKLFLQTSLSWYLLITIHTSSFVYLILFFAIFTLITTLNNLDKWKNFFFLGITILYGCMLAIWFLAPLELFSNYLMGSYSYTSTEHMVMFHPSLMYLLSPYANITANFRYALLSIHPSIGLPILAAASLCCYTATKSLFLKNKLSRKWIYPLLIVFFIAFYLAWSPTNIWGWLPKQLLVGQYCWRLLSQVTWIGALLFACGICWALEKKIKLKYILAISLLMIATSLTWFPHKILSLINLEQFIKEPSLIYNNDTYLFNFIQNPKIVSQIDNLRITPDVFLKLNYHYVINNKLLELTTSPVIMLNGSLPKELLNQKLVVSSNEGVIQTITLNNKMFNWKIPFKASKTTTTYLKFNLNSKSKKINQITLENFLLTGFLSQDETLSVKKVQSLCLQKNSFTQCNINVNKKIKLIELPILYYPQMLNITVNDRPTQYESILFKGYLIAGIKPQEGMNNIKIKFIGLNWANKMSMLSWSLWVIILILVIKDYTRESLAQKRK